MRLEKLQITVNFLKPRCQNRGPRPRLKPEPEASAEDSGRIFVADYLMAPSISFTGNFNMTKGVTAASFAAALALASLAATAPGQSSFAFPASPSKSTAAGAEAPDFKNSTARLKPRPSGLIADNLSSKRPGGEAANQTGAARPPSDAEIVARAKVLLEHQHANDEALEQYERVEHHVDRTG